MTERLRINRQAERPSTVSRQPSTVNNMNILIVEDEQYTAELLQEVIERDNDFSVVNRLASIEETVHFLRKNHSKPNNNDVK